MLWGKILVRVKEKYLECEKPEGVNEEILGSLILEVSKIDKLPAKLKVVKEYFEDKFLVPFFDKEGIEKIYRNICDHDNCVMATERFLSEGLPNAGVTEDGCYITYYSFEEETYKKLMELFEKENRLFQYSC